MQLGDRPHLDKLVGPVKTLIDEYIAGEVDEVHVFYTTFINTMKQEPRHGRIVPIPAPVPDARPARCARPRSRDGAWDYIYEPDARELLDGMMRRYIEAIVFQMVNENMASEQSARMVAMKAAIRQRRQDHPGAAAHLQQDAAGGDHQGTLGDRRRRGGGLATAIEIELIEESTMSQGTIVQCIGAVVDVEFPRDEMPEDLRRAVLEQDATNSSSSRG